MSGITFIPPWVEADVLAPVAMASCGPEPGEDGADDEPYDDTLDHERCEDCNGTGWYVGLRVRERCKTCDGAGWV